MPHGTIDPAVDYVAELSRTSSKTWPTIAQAHMDANAVQELLGEKLRQYTSDDVDIVVFGSLARREWTCGSDVDWTMLVDGQANAEHRIASRETERELNKLTFRDQPLKGPGAEGIFGNLAFSHEIVHHIGGQADTNRNTTQRILLLLEAAPLREPKGDLGPFERIVRQILNRYLASDSNFHSQSDERSRIPRFLLNDIVRYWRTMCVDFAYKDWEQGGKKWALRNIKLRMSRKLLFVAGLFMVFSCFQNASLRRPHGVDVDYLLKLQEHLLNFVHSTPLNIVVWTLDGIDRRAKSIELLDIYEQFLASINDKDTRDHLAELSETAVYEDERFMKCRDISHRFQAVLKHLCFEEESPLREFTCEYGVF